MCDFFGDWYVGNILKQTTGNMVMDYVTGEIVFEYGEYFETINYEYDKLNRLSSEITNEKTTNDTYDEMGNI